MRRLPAPEPHETGRCPATSKQTGRRCGSRAGAGTPHKGEGACKFHGGLSPVRHGRYSQIKRDSLRDLITQYEADPDPLSIFAELAAARALFHDYVERYSAWADALIAWHDSYRTIQRPLSAARVGALGAVLDEYEALLRESGEPTEQQESDLVFTRETLMQLTEVDPAKPRQILDIADAYRIVSEVTKIVERIEGIRAANAISRPDMLRVMTEMGRVVEAHVREQATRDTIREGWLAIRVA